MHIVRWLVIPVTCKTSENLSSQSSVNHCLGYVTIMTKGNMMAGPKGKGGGRSYCDAGCFGHLDVLILGFFTIVNCLFMA
jgi:hypothetical protein